MHGQVLEGAVEITQLLAGLVRELEQLDPWPKVLLVYEISRLVRPFQEFFHLLELAESRLGLVAVSALVVAICASVINGGAFHFGLNWKCGPWRFTQIKERENCVKRILINVKNDDSQKPPMFHFGSGRNEVEKHITPWPGGSHEDDVPRGEGEGVEDTGLIYGD